jgi:hypothetical protein
MDGLDEVKITLVTGNSTGFIDSLAKEIGKEKIAQDVIKVTDSHEKGAFPLDPSTLIVSLAASGGVLTTLIGLIQTKLTKEKSVSIEIDGSKLLLTGINDETQKEFIQLWMKQVSKKQKRKVRK